MTDSTRNPLIIPEGPVAPTKRRGCPKCGAANWDAFSSDGVHTFRCRECKESWQGGLPGLPQDPTKPMPPVNPKDRPNVIFTKTKESGDRLVPVLDKRPDLTPDFRKGALIPGDDDA